MTSGTVKILSCLLIGIAGVAYFGFVGLAQANMSSTSYKIQYDNLNITSGTKTGSTYRITDTVGQNAPGQYTSTGYIVKSGFQYMYTLGEFSFTISNTAVNLGELTPGTFSTGTTQLTVSAKGAGGYSVTAFENHPLKRLNLAATIPDTTCNAGTCTESTAGVWNSTSSYGFGYNMSGDDVPAAFVDSTYFKQFADNSTAETAQVVMSNAGVVTSNQSTVTYKANVSSTQEAGKYENGITYIATPGY